MPTIYRSGSIPQCAPKPTPSPGEERAFKHRGWEAWDDRDTDYLRGMWRNKSPEFIAQMLGRTINSVKARAKLLGFRK